MAKFICFFICPLFLVTATLLDSLIAYAVLDVSEVVRNSGVSVAWLGNSAWMAIIILILAIISAVFSNASAHPLTRKQAKLFLQLCIVIFLIILISSVFAQLLKLFIGRVRPMYISELGAFYFNPFSLSTSYHSFPSEHATTIAAVMMVCLRLFPNYWSLFFLITLLSGGASVISGSHYPSDVIAGWLLGGMISFILLEAFEAARIIPTFDSLRWRSISQMNGKMFKTIFFSVPLARLSTDVNFLKNAITLLMIMFVTLVIFISYPQIDLKISALFYDDFRGFWLSTISELNLIRSLYTATIFCVFLGALFLLCLSARAPHFMQIPWIIWSYIVLALMIGPGLISNAIFKSYWGRARPASIDEFGGESRFTLPFELTQECESNCSFVSGEGSGIAMLVLVIISLIWPYLRKKPFYLAPIIGIASFGIILRIMKGRHFFSDTVFAVLFMALVLLVLYRLLEIDRYRRAITWSALRHDIINCSKYLTGSHWQSVSMRRDLIRVFHSVSVVFTKPAQILKATITSTRFY
ncbi:MAG: phosphatase PAP2 family protein [Rhizobiaceae bacterium]|nr:phosphatase PAP2 family protein [Rhizobiaceae bacterium]